MQWVAAVVHDAKQPLCSFLYGAAPQHTTPLEERAKNRLVEHQQHFSAEVEGCQSPQEMQPALHFLVDIFGVN